MNEFSNNIIYPEFSTFTSLKLNSAPESGNLPPEGYVYQWETIVNNEVYSNYLFSDGVKKEYPLKSSEKEIHVEIPGEVADFVFSPSDVVNGILTVNYNFTISEIGFYTDENKGSWLVVNLPIICDKNTSKIMFSDIPQSEYQHGGIIRFSRGTTVLNYSDDIYNIASAISGQTFNADYGLIQIIQNVSDDLSISAGNIKNLKEGNMIKIIVNNSSGKKIQVNNEMIEFEKFAVCYINVFGVVQRIGEVIAIGG